MRNTRGNKVKGAVLFNILMQLVVVLAVLASCKGTARKSMSVEEYSRWVSNPENGLVKERIINGLKISVQYMPDELLQARKGAASKGASGKASKTFLMSIGLEERTGAGNADLMMADVNSLEEYKAKFTEMHFQLNNYVELEVDSEAYMPVLFELEPTYGLGKDLVTTFVFSPAATTSDLIAKKSYRFAFDDRFFGTGKNYFVFEPQALDHLPELIR